MKRRKMFESLLIAVSLLAGSILPVLPAKADAMRVVTLGADLSQAQQDTMLKYFKVNKDEVRIIYVTIQDEIEHLATYVPMEQIGTRTVSCAYVRPTTSGGIKVRTANLNWVTGNMIAASLSTSGVTNCEVIAACPFEVSGTGALTGVQMAYEVAVGEKLDARKKEIATEEIVVTGNVGNAVGQDAATYVINRAKIEVLGRGLKDYEDIYNLVIDITDENHLKLTDQMIYDIVNLLYEMVEENYRYEDVVDTLAMVGTNVAEAAEDDFFTDNGGFSEIAPADIAYDEFAIGEAAEDDFDEDSIVIDLDESVLGDDIVVSSTLNDVEDDEEDVEDDDDWFIFDGSKDVVGSGEEDYDDFDEEDYDDFDEEDYDDFDEEDFDEDDEPSDEGSWLQYLFGRGDEAKDSENDDDLLDDEDLADDDLLDDEDLSDDDLLDDEDLEDDDLLDDVDLGDDEYIFGDDLQDDSLIVDDDLSEEEIPAGDTDEDEDVSKLSADKQHFYSLAGLFCQGEFEGSYKKPFKRLKKELGITLDAPSVSLDSVTGKALSGLILDRYLSILSNAGSSIPSASDEFVSPELNKIKASLQKVFGVDDIQDEDAAKVLAHVWDDEARLLFDDTMTFFAGLYGEEYSGDETGDTLTDDDLTDDLLIDDDPDDDLLMDDDSEYDLLMDDSEDDLTEDDSDDLLYDEDLDDEGDWDLYVMSDDDDSMDEIAY